MGRACAEALGFDSVWISDHFFYSFGRYGADPSPIASLEPLTTLAALAVRTERVRLGTLVLGAPFRHPGAAREDRGVDRRALRRAGSISASARAGFEDEFRAFGYGFGSVGDRFERLDELSRSSPPSPSGRDRLRSRARRSRSASARALPPAVQRPIPVWVGGKGGPRLLRLAARHAAGWNVVWRMSPEGYAAKIVDVRAACEAVGRDPATFRLRSGSTALDRRRRRRSSGGVRAWPRVDARRRARRGAVRGLARRHAVGLPTRSARASPRSRRWGAGDHRVALGPAVRDPRAEQVELFAELVLEPRRAAR